VETTPTNQEQPPRPIKTLRVDRLGVEIYPTQEEMAQAAAVAAGEWLRRVLSEKERAAVILASATSQIRFLDRLIRQPQIDWSRLTFFHMDEYLGIPEDHPASFRRFIRERVAEKLPQAAFHYIQGDSPEPLRECRRYCDLLHNQPIDLCCLGIGENGHIAFNDPHVANLRDPHTIKLVQLDEACRKQQVGEGCFPDLNAVPQYAFTITIPGLMRARRIIGVAPERRKAKAVKNALEKEVCKDCPASVLRQHPNAALFLDADSASELEAFQPG